MALTPSDKIADNLPELKTIEPHIHCGEYHPFLLIELIDIIVMYVVRSKQNVLQK